MTAPRRSPAATSENSRIKVGCLSEVLPKPGALLGLDFVELRLRAPHPNTAAQKKWRVSQRVPANLVIGPFLSDPRTQPGLSQPTRERINKSIYALEPKFVILETGRLLTPSARHMEHLAVVIEQLRKLGATVLWSPKGLFEGDTKSSWAKQLGVAVTYNPLSEPAPELAYGRVPALGVHARLSDNLIESLAIRLAELEQDVWVAFESARAAKVARVLKTANRSMSVD